MTSPGRNPSHGAISGNYTRLACGVRRLAEHSFPARTLRHLPDGDACAPRMTEPLSTVGASEKRVAALRDYSCPAWMAVMAMV